VTELNFGSALTVGVEEELMILDPETFSQRPASHVLIPAVPTDRGRVKTELFQSVIELNTDICESPSDAAGVLRQLRRSTIDTAKSMGFAIAGAGSHPFDIASVQPIAAESHYEKFVAYAGPTARRQGVSGLHVHVGMPDAETCLRVQEAILPWLPLVLALSANSPWFEAGRTGMMSTRAEILGLLPRHGAPPVFESWSDWERLVNTFVGSKVVDNYNAIHWDIRPHPSFGTLEVRMPDQPTTLTQTVRFVELLHGLCRWALDTDARAPLSRVVYDQNRWAASRFGPRANLIDATKDRAATVPELYAELVDLVGFDPGFDSEVCEADDQLAFDRPEDAAADLVERSVA
jgi:glutamate---cysteine ligase / carboxylate-amine ligase